MSFIIPLLVILLIVLLIAALIRRAERDPVIYQIHHDSGDEEEVTTTTTTTTVVHDQPIYNGVAVTVGTLARHWDNGQLFVIDPADGMKCYVNTNDDMYEDAQGRIWQLI